MHEAYCKHILRKVSSIMDIINEIINQHYLMNAADSEELAKSLESRYRERPFIAFLNTVTVGHLSNEDFDKIMDILNYDKLVARHLIWDIHDTCFHTDFNSYYSCEKTSLKELELVISETIK